MIIRFKNYPNEIIPLIEGIDIDHFNKVVKVNLNLENGINTSIDYNPTYHKIGDYEIISIFKRNGKVDADGNPLLYALKGLKDWKIESYDIKLLMKQFIRIVEKIDPLYDTIIKIPSNNELNNYFMFHLNKILKSKNKIETIFSKLSPEEVWDNGIDFQNMNKDDFKEMQKSFGKMEDIFTFKVIPVRLRKYIKKIYNDNTIFDELDVAEKINNKNVIILDDTVSTGSTISLFVENFIKIYEPKDIKVITLFSPL